MDVWMKLASLVDDLEKEKVVNIALVGKYTGLSDAYLSVIKVSSPCTKFLSVLSWYR